MFKRIHETIAEVSAAIRAVVALLGEIRDKLPEGDTAAIARIAQVEADFNSLRGEVAASMVEIQSQN